MDRSERWGFALPPANRVLGCALIGAGAIRPSDCVALDVAVSLARREP